MKGDAKMPVTSFELTEFLKSEFFGEHRNVVTVCSLNRPRHNAVTFATKFDPNVFKKIESIGATCIVSRTAPIVGAKSAYLIVDNPRLAFSRILEHYFAPKPSRNIAESARISPSARIGKDVSIGEYCVIGANCEIGDRSVLRNHVSLASNVVMGTDCLLKSHCVIGEEGFGIEDDEAGNRHRIPHVGGVTLGDFVEVGCSTVIAGGTIDPTLIGSHAKIDDQVFIAHNCEIGDNALVIAGAEISGSVVIGAGAWIGPQVCVLNKVQIGSNALVGLGAVVIKNVPENAIVAGNPAKLLRYKNDKIAPG